MKKKTQVLATEDDLLDLTFHSVPASLLSEFAEKIVKPYYRGNLNAAIQDLLHKTLAEQNFIQSHITHIKSTEVWCMGKTVPSFRMALEFEINHWRGFRKALLSDVDREAFGELRHTMERKRIIYI